MIGRVKSLFQKKPEADGTVGSVRELVVAPKEVQPMDPLTGFINNLQKLKKRDPAIRDHLYIISLADFRKAVGEKWPKLSVKVGRLGENVVGRHVGRDGMFCQADEQTFVVTLPKEPREKARNRVVRIAQDLSSYLLGDLCIKGERPLILAANIPFDQAIGSHGGFELDALAQAVADSRSMATMAGIEAETALANLSSLEVFRVGEAISEPPQAVAPRSQDPIGLEMGGPAAPVLDPEWRQFTQRTSAEARRFPWDDPGPLNTDTRLSMVWRPTWLAATETIGAYAARILRFENAGTPPTEGSHTYPHRHIHDCLNIDRFVLNQFARQAQAASTLNPAPMLIAPLNWVCIDSEHRRALFGPVMDLPRQVKRERLQIEITHLPDVPDHRRISEALSFVRELGLGVIVRARLINMPWLLNAQITSKLVLDLSELSPEERIGDAPLLAKISGLRATAAANGAAFGLWGARRRNVIAALVKDGFSFVSGPGLMGDQNQVRPTIPLSKASLIGTL
jgi:hypothetical protein